MTHRLIDVVPRFCLRSCFHFSYSSCLLRYVSGVLALRSFPVHFFDLMHLRFFFQCFMMRSRQLCYQMFTRIDHLRSWQYFATTARTSRCVAAVVVEDPAHGAGLSKVALPLTGVNLCRPPLTFDQSKPVGIILITNARSTVPAISPFYGTHFGPGYITSVSAS